MIRQISKILTAVESHVSSSKREEKRRKKMVEHLDWRPEARAKNARNARLSRLQRE